jgi:hypothetical protein
MIAAAADEVLGFMVLVAEVFQDLLSPGASCRRRRTFQGRV